MAVAESAGYIHNSVVMFQTGFSARLASAKYIISFKLREIPKNEMKYHKQVCNPIKRKGAQQLDYWMRLFGLKILVF